MNVTELCVNCKQNNSCTMCWKTSNKKCPHFIQKTNADRIRAMSDEELREFLYTYCFVDICDEGCDKCRYNGDCERRLADWLKQPAKGE